MNSTAKSIGVFDSGVGGLTVLRAIREALPAHHIVYYADTAHLPYGNREPGEILTFASYITEYLLSRGAAVIAVACNTSSALALSRIRERYSVPIVGMIDCGASAAARASASGRIGVIATLNTVRSMAYASAITSRRREAVVVQQACPDLVPLVEAGELHGAQVASALKGYLGPLLGAGVDTVLYGCTHYPFLHGEVRAVVGTRVALVDPARQVAAEVASTVAAEGIAGERPDAPDVRDRGVDFVTSGDPDQFRRIASTLLGHDIGEVATDRGASGGRG